MKLILEVISGQSEAMPNRATSHVFQWLDVGQSLVVGRNRWEADVVVRDDEKVSQRHFQVACEVDVCLLRDLGSTNGTFLNGKQIEQAEVTDGDEIRAADTIFKIHLRSTGGMDVSDVDNGAELSVAGTAVDSPLAADDASRRPATSGADDGWELELAELAPTPQPTANAPGVREDPALAELPAAAPTSQVSPINVGLLIHDGPVVTVNSLVSRMGAWIREGQRLIVGRSAMHADWAIGSDAYMSARHFQLSCEQGRCILTDLESTGGTFVNDVAVSSALLRDQDLIGAGKTVFKVGVHDGETITDAEVRASTIPAKER